MPDWKDPEVISLCAYVFNQMTVFVVGVYGWELVYTFGAVEWPLLTRRMLFRPVFIPYLIGRYCTLCAILSIIIENRTNEPINCQVGYEFSTLIGLLGICCCSINLVIRPLVLWKHCRWVLVALVLLSALQLGYSIFVGVTNAKGSWNMALHHCTLQDSAPYTTATLYLYTMLFDFVILVFTLLGLSRYQSRSTMWRQLHDQGIWYFVIAWAVNMPTAIISFMDLNIVMNLFWPIPALTLSMIASCRMVTGMMKLNEEQTISEMPADRAGAWGRAQSDKVAEQQQLSTNVPFPSALDSYDIGIN